MAGGRRMEDLLMGGGDDDSSGSDDDNGNESQVAGGGSDRQASLTATDAAPSSTMMPTTTTTTTPLPPPPVVTTAAAATTTAAAATPHRSISGHLAKPPIVGPRGDSKSELTNRLKNLYGTAGGGSGVGGAMVSPPMLPPPQIVPNVNSNTNNAAAKASTLNVSSAAASAAATNFSSNNNNNSYIPPMVYTAHHRGGTGGGSGSGPSSSSNQQQPMQQQQQQHHHPGLLQNNNANATSTGRIPAPLPEARSSNRSAPPSNRIAMVPMSRPSSNGNNPSSSSSNAMMPSGPPPPSPLTTASQQQQQQQQQLAQYGRSSSNSSSSSNSNRQQLPQQQQQQQQYAYQPHSQRGSIGSNTSAAASSRSSLQQQQMQQQRQQQMQHSVHPSMQQQQQQQDLMQGQESMGPTSYNNNNNLSSGSSSRSSYSERGGGNSGTSNSAVVAGSSMAYLPEQEKKEKERFLMFTRVLMKYLEQRDPQMHQVAKAQIKECYEKNKLGDPEFRSLTTSMNTRLRATVGDVYWKKAQDYLGHFIRQKREGDKQSTTSTTTTSSSFPPPLPSVSGLGSAPLAGSAPLPPAIVPTGIPHNSGGGVGGVNTSTNSLLSATITIPSAPTSIKPGKKRKDPAITKEQKNQLARENRAKKKKEAAAKAAAAAAAAAGSVRTMLPTGVGIAHSTTTTTTTTSMTTPGLVASSSNSSGGVRSVSAVVAAAAAAAGTLASSQSTVASTTVATNNVSNILSSSPTPPNMKVKNEKLESGGSKSAKRKSLTKSTTLSPLITKKKQQEPSNLFMESIDHATLFDVKRLPNVFTSKEYKLDVNINEEQKVLLYGDDEEHQKKMREIAKAARMALDADMDSLDSKFKEAGVLPLPSKIPSMYNGWGEKNILSVRNAWARVRLPESEIRRAELEKEASEKMPQTKPTILEVESEQRSEGQLSPSSVAVDVLTIENDITNHVWFNEIRAEQDMTLALLSVATEQYIKSTIEEALGKARLRQNLDGVRLWHTLQAHHHAAATSMPSTITSMKHTVEDPPFPPPPALIRLGCDVRRQIALSEGNAAKVYQRMEEAISRRNDHCTDDNEKILLESTSMADFSKKVPLKCAVQRADTDAKRKFAVFSGVDCEPPLGRVPKEAKITLQDLAVSALGSRESTIGLRRKRFRAGWNF